MVALLPFVASAAGLGKLTVLSALGQPLDAEIELLSVTKEELSSLNARLASPDAYRQANLQYSSAVAGARLSIEQRAGGQLYIKITSTRPVNEPFVDLLVELAWASGRLAREYTALIDPPGATPPPLAPAVSAPPVTRPAPEPAAAAPEAPRPAPIRPIAGAGEYGPIERGETLGKIAKSVMPEGVTLEQMLVGLYRSNPEVFIRKNLNLIRTGKILRVPDSAELTGISQGEAVKEYRAHVADWNTYRQQLADAAGVTPAEGRPAVSGKITTKVEDKMGSEPKDVVRLSKGEPPGAAAGAGKGKPSSNAERIRMLEEEAVAREKALNEANERIAQLEKTIKDMQKLIELKSPGLAAAQQQTVKPEAAPVAKSEAPKPEAPAAPKPKPGAAPPPEPDLVDQIIEAVTDPLYLGTGGGVIVLGGLAFWLMRRRRPQADENDISPKEAPRLGTAAAAAAGAVAATPIAAAATQTGAATDEVDPLAEADVYIAYGRDQQAEEILKEALAGNPKREDVQLKLLEIYAARKDKAAFGKTAGDLNRLTGGAGDNWLKAATMGFALDPANALYAAGRSAAPAAAGAGTTPGSDLDFDLGVGTGTGTSTDITLEAGTLQEAAAGTQQPAGAMPDFTLEVPAAGGTATDIALDAAPAKDDSVIDFQIELPKVEADQPTVAAAPPAAAGAGLDFKLDVPDFNLGEDRTKTEAAPGGEKNGQWYDVQTKFDLAKAYQEMGDKDGAKEILQEVIKEGDAEQKAQAKALLDNIG